MKYAIFLILLVSAISLFGQIDPKVSGNYQNAPLAEVLADFEQQVPLQFYYAQVWVDSISVTANFTQVPLQEALRQVFEGTDLTFYRKGNRLVVLRSVTIIDQPALANALQSIEETDPEVDMGLIFSREYQNQLKGENDLETFVFEVGSRSKTTRSGTSTIAGYVRNVETQEAIGGAFVFIDNPFTGATTDESGFYSITIPNGKRVLNFQNLGFKPTRRNVVLFSNGTLNVDMEVDIIALQEITVQADRDINVTNVQMGVTKFNVEEVKNVPVVLGERDILKIATTKAGVQTVGEGASGFNVRGGKADQNLILINDAPIYNSTHFFGFFSVFNSDAIQNMELFKSGIPAQYGGRLSSVFDIKSKVASKEKFAGEGGISPITSKLTLQIPLKKDQTSLLIGGRSTYSNWVLQNVPNAGFKDNRVSFYDLLTQLDHKISDKDHLSVSAYVSKDKFRLNSDTLFSFSNFSFMNANGSVKWKRRFSDRLDGTFTGVFASYQYDLLYDESLPNAFTQDFDLQEGSVKADMAFYPDDVQKIAFGAEIKRYHVNPGEKLPLGSESIVMAQTVQPENGLESSIYISDEYQLSNRVSFYAGIRYTMFNALGPGSVFVYEDGLPKNRDTRIDSLYYNSGEITQTYHGPEWRLSGRYSLNGVSSLKLSYSRNRQYIHVLSNSAALSPTDTWRLSSPHLKPQRSDQLAMGYYRNLMGNKLEFSAEGYYKWLDNLVDFKTGADFLLNQYIERDVLQGPGKSYGLEVSLTKSGKLNGWINYAYARTFIQLDGESQEERVNGGAFYPTGYDKPHTFNLVANYKLTRRFSFSVNTTYTTGRPVTYPVAIYDFKGSQSIHYSDRNAYRIPDYFRIDLGLNLEGNHKVRKLSHSFWSLSIYNLTGRDNPFSVFFDVQNGRVLGSQLIVFGNPIPTLSYNFKF